MKTTLSYFLLLIGLLTGCAKIPVESVTLAESVAAEGTRMHDLNIALLNSMFKSKSAAIDSFMRYTFTPAYVENFMKTVPEGTDLKKEMPEIIASLIPEINAIRDEMQSALENQRIKLTTKLDQDYTAYRESINALHNLLQSSVKLDNERKALLDRLNKLSGEKVDLDKVEKTLDSFILGAGDVADKINDLNKNMDSILKK